MVDRSEAKVTAAHLDATVDLDRVMDAAAAFGGQLAVPMWLESPFIDYESGLHGDAWGWDTPPDVLRKWHMAAQLVDDDIVVLATKPTKSEVRGRAFPGKYPVKINYLHPHGHKWGSREGKFLDFIGGRWVTTGHDSGALSRPTYERVFSENIEAVMMHLFESEYAWRAVFHEVRPGAASFVVPTDARGALSLFRLRDKPDGYKRRPALRHWVQAHCRATRSGGMTDVVEHLRGKTIFTWSGMNVELHPSPSDLEAAMRAKS